MTNAIKAQIIALVNAALIAAIAFGVPLSDAQIGGIGLVVNTALSLYVALTYKSSPKRVAELTEEPTE